MREQCIGKCDKCMVEFKYYLVHNGFNESCYAYCDSCGRTAFLWLVPSKIPEQYRNYFKRMPIGEKINGDIESFMEKCSCGGTFKHDASPRCPSCKNQLSAIAAKEYIEKNAPGTRKGWKWQNNWDDLYAIVIENNVVRDNWR
jgi:hypothetical protein